ncbi:MAG: hypothetical protein ACPG7F_09845, partial [Aggregatilineales bacterium]
MRKFSMIALLTVMALVLVACGDTGDSASDANSAQNLQPNLPEYTVTTSDSLEDAITAAAGAAALGSGNVPLAAGIARAEVVVQCLKDAGVADARAYVQKSPTNIVPESGVSFVLNQSRLTTNLVNCLTTTGGDISAQAVVIEPCPGSGEFTRNEEEFIYMYIGVGTDICGKFQQHFTNLESGT